MIDPLITGERPAADIPGLFTRHVAESLLDIFSAGRSRSLARNFRVFSFRPLGDGSRFTSGKWPYCCGHGGIIQSFPVGDPFLLVTYASASSVSRQSSGFVASQPKQLDPALATRFKHSQDDWSR